MKHYSEWTRKQFEALPSREWDQDIGEFDALVILPSEINQSSLLLYNILEWLAARITIIRKPEIYKVDGMHDSGFRCMDFIAIKDDKPVCRLSGGSDVIHFDGIGGWGHKWFELGKGIPETIMSRAWSIDCLKKSGLLRIFCNSKLIAGNALSSFELFGGSKL